MSEGSFAPILRAAIKKALDDSEDEWMHETLDEDSEGNGSWYHYVEVEKIAAIATETSQQYAVPVSLFCDALNMLDRLTEPEVSDESKAYARERWVPLMRRQFNYHPRPDGPF